MDTLPDELLLSIVSFLQTRDFTRIQHVSKRFKRLARDGRLWREQCFLHSRTAVAASRYIASSPALNSRLAALRDAILTLPIDDAHGIEAVNFPSTGSAKIRALASWDPKYAGEDFDYYSEYIHRHAPIAPIAWLTMPANTGRETSISHEATGIGLLRGADGLGEHIVAPFDDGTVRIFSAKSTSTSLASIPLEMMGKSAAGLLSGINRKLPRIDSKAIMTETGAIECVTIDSSRQRGLFAVQNRLNEIDLQTLQLVSTREYPFPISALSAVNPDGQIMVGTSWTVHFNDSRVARSVNPADDNVRHELIGGSVASHVTLTQPGPLSILQESMSDSVWIAGRFTHLLQYDRRFFPKLRGSVHSGAKISALSSLPFPMLSRNLDFTSNPNVLQSTIQAEKSARGSTLIAAGVYKGKGSLELYGLDGSNTNPTQRGSREYKNRHTAAASKLLSVVPHGGSIVVSDSDGHIKWFERNGRYGIRSVDINDHMHLEPMCSLDRGDNLHSAIPPQDGAQMFAEAQEPGHGDIVQKILPFHSENRALSGTTRSSATQNPLLLWTGDGRIGMLGFGHRSPYTFAHPHDEERDDTMAHRYSSNGVDDDSLVEADERLQAQARRMERLARQDAERRYVGCMRRALEGQAIELRFMGGLGL